MPKKKKTRKQKIISDTRHRDYAKFTLSSQVNPPTQMQSEPARKPQTTYQPQQSTGQLIATSQYAYLYSDLLKTFALTFSIIIAEIVLGFFFFGAQ